MNEMKLCEACEMEFDWPCVERDGAEYCCAACSEGRPCTCPQHHHGHATDQPLHTAATRQVGVAPNP